VVSIFGVSEELREKIVAAEGRRFLGVFSVQFGRAGLATNCCSKHRFAPYCKGSQVRYI
jgi:hypothetical protein